MVSYSNFGNETIKKMTISMTIMVMMTMTKMMMINIAITMLITIIIIFSFTKPWHIILIVYNCSSGHKNNII